MNSNTVIFIILLLFIVVWGATSAWSRFVDMRIAERRAQEVARLADALRESVKYQSDVLASIARKATDLDEALAELEDK